MLFSGGKPVFNGGTPVVSPDCPCCGGVVCLQTPRACGAGFESRQLDLTTCAGTTQPVGEVCCDPIPGLGAVGTLRVVFEASIDYLEATGTTGQQTRTRFNAVVRESWTENNDDCVQDTGQFDQYTYEATARVLRDSDGGGVLIDDSGSIDQSLINTTSGVAFQAIDCDSPEATCTGEFGLGINTTFRAGLKNLNAWDTRVNPRFSCSGSASTWTRTASQRRDSCGNEQSSGVFEFDNASSESDPSFTRYTIRWNYRRTVECSLPGSDPTLGEADYGDLFPGPSYRTTRCSDGSAGPPVQVAAVQPAIDAGYTTIYYGDCCFAIDTAETIPDDGHALIPTYPGCSTCGVGYYRSTRCCTGEPGPNVSTFIADAMADLGLAIFSHMGECYRVDYSNRFLSDDATDVVAPGLYPDCPECYAALGLPVPDPCDEPGPGPGDGFGGGPEASGGTQGTDGDASGGNEQQVVSAMGTTWYGQPFPIQLFNAVTGRRTRGMKECGCNKPLKDRLMRGRAG